MRELYDRARTAVDDSLADVVRAESRTQRRQHAEQQQRHSEDVEALRQRFEQQAAENEILRQQFERLDGQMARLAQDYETLAAMLRGRWT